MQAALRVFGKIAQTALAVLLVAIAGCGVYLIVAERALGVEHPAVFGYSTAVVVSGSMEPALSVGDLIINRAQSDYAVGDVITFDSGASLTTHRIVEKLESGYVTQGDANNAADSNVVLPEDVVGKVVSSVPLAGDLVVFLRSPVGLSALVFAGFLVFWLPSFLARSEDEETGKEVA